jgi:hypothetical protein
MEIFSPRSFISLKTWVVTLLTLVWTDMTVFFRKLKQVYDLWEQREEDFSAGSPRSLNVQHLGHGGCHIVKSTGAPWVPLGIFHPIQNRGTRTSYG